MPAGKTYVKVASTTISGTSTSTITYSNLPQNYTDLVLVINGSNSTDQNFRVRFNSDTGSNYSNTRLEGDGSTAYSQRLTNQTSLIVSAGNHTNIGIFIAQIMNYSNSTTYKTVLTRSAIPATATTAFCGLYRSTNAVRDLTILISSGYIVAGTTFTLYGIAASQAPQAVGGTITTDGSYWIHTFTSSGLFIPQQSINNVDYLVVAGGGGGGSRFGGGGGAGGLRSTVTATGGGGSLESKINLSANTVYTVTVGAGGNGSSSSLGNGSQGSNSVFASITSTGGGYGAGTTGNATGGTGGSAGGGTGAYTAPDGAGGTRTSSPVQGNNGGTGGKLPDNSYYRAGGGGGGAGAQGTTVVNGSSYGPGGNGVAVAITGSSVTYAGGGGGGIYGSTGSAAGGSGGGGSGLTASTGGTATSGTANTGGGGGGAGSDAGSGGSGGSGIVIVRYPI